MIINDLSDEFRINYMQLYLKPNTIRGYERNLSAYIQPYFGSEALESINYSSLTDFVSHLSSSGLSNTSIVYSLATFSAMFSYAILRGYTSSNPLLTFKYPRKNKFQYNTLTQVQLESLLEHTKDKDEFPALLFACHYGLRRGEACGIKFNDIVNDILYVRRTVTQVQGKLSITTPKNDKIRCVKLLENDRKLLLNYNKIRKKNPSGFLMRDSEGQIVSPNAINKRLKKHLAMLDLPDIRFHDLRHSYATVMMQNGVNPKIVSMVLGHSSVDITLDLYSHCYVNFQDACLKVFEAPEKGAKVDTVDVCEIKQKRQV